VKFIYPSEVLNYVKDMLIKKNQDYGNSALQPINIFSECSAVEQLSVRIDDKLKRFSNSGRKNYNEDTILDLIGYLVILYIALEGRSSYVFSEEVERIVSEVAPKYKGCGNFVSIFSNDRASSIDTILNHVKKNGADMSDVVNLINALANYVCEMS